MENLDRRMLLAGLGLVGVAAASAANAGTLNPPPGPVAPTGKTTDEIEPRKDVLSLPGDADSLHVINLPGSYYLTGNITGAPARNGIKILSGDVTLDLNGFELVGGAGSLNGIFFLDAGGYFGNTIRNGMVRAVTESVRPVRVRPASRVSAQPLIRAAASALLRATWWSGAGPTATEGTGLPWAGPATSLPAPRRATRAWGSQASARERPSPNVPRSAIRSAVSTLSREASSWRARPWATTVMASSPTKAAR